ncbi:hypothetical protein L204_101069 [Cryptococcus depauperatus]|nr:hypothetical protein L204_01003 [Cryptococcus depauperatus CBS 7855]
MSSEQHQHHVVGGYKATLNNPRVSEEAKAHASEVIQEYEKHGEAAIADIDSKKPADSGDQHENHVNGGYKATLNNPNVSKEAKEHARKVLEN